jgi:hypothetical protein
MKWIIVVISLFILTGSTTYVPICNLGEFKSIGLTTHDPYERSKKAIAWLKQIGPVCSKEDVVKIYNSLAYVLGTSDSSEIRGITYDLYLNAK